jgi:hypothetical protein
MDNGDPFQLHNGHKCYNDETVEACASDSDDKTAINPAL